MKNKINNKGFTLIELLAIIAITAIILGVGTYGIVNLVNKSKEKGSLISETSIKESASLYADEAGDSLWIDPGSGDYKYYCITIEELINKGIIKKNAKLPKGIDKYNYVSIKKNKVTFVKNDPIILGSNADINSTDYKVCTGNKFEEDVSKRPEFTGNKSLTDSLEVSFNDGKAESAIKDKWCQYDTTSSISGDKNIIVLDSKTNTCNIDKNLTNKTSYYVRICMSTVRGSTMCSGTNSYSTADFINPEFSTKDDTITIKYKDDNVKEPYHYFKSNVNGTSDKNVSECTLGSDNKFTCSGSTSNITKDKWYKVNENEVKITYKDNEIKNGDITARIMDGTGNYKDSDKKFNLYRIVFKKGNADKINNGTNDITNICLNDIDKRCSIKSPSISKKGYTIVGWNTDSSASDSIWKVNTSKDIDGSNTYYPIIKSRVNIKLNVNHGSVTKQTPKGGEYITDPDGTIRRKGNNSRKFKDIFHTINYGEKMNSNGLANYNNEDYLNITRKGFTTNEDQEWICLSGCTQDNKVFSQTDQYAASDFCDAKENNCIVVLGVNWIEKQYTISYNANGGTGTMESDTVSYNGNATIRSNDFERDGYTFAGWTTNSNGTDDGHRWTNWSGTWEFDNGDYGINNNKLVLYARWVLNSYTLSIDPNGGWRTGDNNESVITVSKNYNSTETISERIRTGYTLTGYKMKNSINESETDLGGAKFVFDANSKEGEFTQGSVPITLTAQWKNNNYTFNLNILNPDGSEPYQTGEAGSIEMSVNDGTWEKIHNEPTGSYPYGTILKFRNFVSGVGRKLSSVSGVTQNSDGTWSKTITSDTVVEFKTAWNNYNISYNANRGTGTMESDTVSYNGNYVIKQNKFKRTGYTFVGWNTKSDGSGTTYKAGDSYNINADLILYAKWRVNKVYIKLNANGGNVKEKVSEEKSCGKSTTGIINCSWNKSDGEIFHTINYGKKMNKNGLANYNNEDYLNITRKGFTTNEDQEWICLSGCTQDNKVFSQTDQYAASDFCDAKENNCIVVLGVNWIEKQYTISYNANGGTGTMESDTVSYNGNATIRSNDFERDGYTFAGWTTNSNGTDDGHRWTNWSGTWEFDNGDYGINNNKLVLYARWVLNSYTLSIDPNGGWRTGDNNESVITVSKNYNSTETISERIRTGYTLTGYKMKNSINESETDLGGAKFVFDANSKEGEFTQGSVPITLTAQWKNNNYTFNLNILNPDGSEPYQTGEAGSIEMSVNDGTWEKIHNEPTGSYPYGTILKFRNFVSGVGRKLSSVSGVTPNSDGTWSTTIESDTVVEFKTAWNNYNISYNANNGTGAPASQSKSYGVEIKLSTSIPTRTGYTFTGWNTKSDGSGTKYNAGDPYNSNADLTLYAQWRINKVYIKLNANSGSVRGSTTYGSCSTNNNLISCSWNKPDGEIFHTINYGDSLDSAGLANYDNPDFVFITRDKNFALANEQWICDSDSGCSTVGKTFDQDKVYKDSDFCDASEHDCTVVLKVNWRELIEDYRCKADDDGIYRIVYCSEDTCIYDEYQYEDANGDFHTETEIKEIDRSLLNSNSCYKKFPDDDQYKGYRCNDNGTYHITICSAADCYYDELNGKSVTNGSRVLRSTLNTSCSSPHEHIWTARGVRIYSIGQSTQFTCGDYHYTGYAVYCAFCGMSKDYYQRHVVGHISGKFVCPVYPYGTPNGWKIYDDCAITTRVKLQEISGGSNRFYETTKNSC